MIIRTKKLSSTVNYTRFLRITLLTGIFFLFLTGVAYSIFFFTERSGSKSSRQQINFARSLREYDLLAVEAESEKEFTRLDRELDKLEKKAISVESWLSVLKRRRKIAHFSRLFINNYRKSIYKALETFPTSQQIAVLASEILVKNIAINPETEQELRGFLPLLKDNSFNNLSLYFYVLLGDFNSPQRAAKLPSELNSDGTESISIDLVILKILRDNIRNAANDIQSIIQYETASSDSLRLAAEFHYDFGDIFRSAELFSFINDEKAMIRQADALYLAGFLESARTIWSMVSGSRSPIERCLYNLGVTSPDNNEAAQWYEKMINLKMDNSDSLQYGIIRYSRMFETTQAITILGGNENIKSNAFPFIDLEICKRLLKNQEVGRQIAETWLLLDRHENIEELYLWAAWLFFFQRNYSEINILLNRLEEPIFSGQWVKVYRAIKLMLEGDLETAETLLRLIPPENLWWPVYANLGCILEAQRSTRYAIEQFQTASEKVQNLKIASRLQERIARCLTTLGRYSEAIIALEHALELDPENLTAKLELDRAIFSY
jgi:tetratricopeptide (TPR) repeat protein